MGAQWTSADEELLQAEYGFTPTACLAKKLGRTPTAIRVRASFMGLRADRTTPPWSSDQERQALQMRELGYTYKQIAGILDCPPRTTEYRVRRLLSGGRLRRRDECA